MRQPGEKGDGQTETMMASVFYVRAGRVWSGWLESETDADGSERTVLVGRGGRILAPHEVSKVVAKAIEANGAVLSRAVKAGYWVEDG
jgi:hypothetical protein